MISKDQKKISIIPFRVDNNQYIELIKSVLGTIDEVYLLDVSIRNYIHLNPFGAFTNRKIDVLVLNWHEGILRGRGNKLTFLSISKFILILLVFRLVCKRLIYVRHNIYPHGMSGAHSRLARRITNLAENIADFKVAHSGHLCSRGYYYVPHPLYEKKILCNQAEYIFKRKKLKKYYIVFGRIEKYKNIHDLLKVWESNGPELVIAGSCSDEKYLKELISISSTKNNIHIFDYFLEELDAQNLVAASEALIITHSEADMIVSGSFFYAATLGVTVLAKSTEFLKWVGDEGLYDGLHTFPSVELLVRCANSANFMRPSKDDLIKQAKNNFGNDVVKQAYLKII